MKKLSLLAFVIGMAATTSAFAAVPLPYYVEIQYLDGAGYTHTKEISIGSLDSSNCDAGDVCYEYSADLGLNKYVTDMSGVQIIMRRANDSSTLYWYDWDFRNSSGGLVEPMLENDWNTSGGRLFDAETWKTDGSNTFTYDPTFSQFDVAFEYKYSQDGYFYVRRFNFEM